MTPLERYRGNAIDAVDLFGDIGAAYRAEVDHEDPSIVDLIWIEEISFHAQDRALAVTDADGEVLSAVPGILQDELRRLLKRDDVDVEISSQDEPAVEVGVRLHVEPATVERLGDMAWPIVATLTNVFDPGTFNAEYVMGNVARRLEE